jgi:hypothetical protein
MSEEKTQMEVTIFGQTLKIRGDADPEMTLKLAEFVDQKMRAHRSCSDSGGPQHCRRAIPPARRERNREKSHRRKGDCDAVAAGKRAATIIGGTSRA